MTEPALDPNHPVIKLCVAGMEAEGHGQIDEAHALFQQAWAACQDDFDACVAAHFLARHRPTPAETLHWNTLALAHADAATAGGAGERLRGFYPSLYLNLGWSYEQLGDLVEAGRHYSLAAAHLTELPSDPYSAVVRRGIMAGQQRVADAEKT